ncbi:sigma-70 family RNA polymerase sigma factor [Acidovorax sp. CCYZU-2555]|uniref:sigma-70 family RNA polymerase sigma factor n=1 Tax=Acidovorax sp. CCYZU-2555 TaxID=2835042 RepID=UPI001BD0661F|nr:sigma-70 family RNA polymerase sigma factor [Acidovorax sp. CCYZU-2555]MBS7780901.1 sigma-70 family RNA polymerase sigma factor [Acidovorax sp. CCYZU-2555]
MFEHYYRELLNFLARKVGDRDLAADIAQESYSRVYAVPDRDAVAEPRALLYTTARNFVTDHHRRTATRLQVEVALQQEESGLAAGLGPASAEPEAVLAGRQRLAAIEQVVAQLPPRAREAFVLYKLDGLSRPEVAAIMGVGVKTVETHLEVAMRACQRRLQELDGELPAAAPRPARKTRSSP